MLAGLGQQGGRFAHEIDAAKDNVFGRHRGHPAGQFQRIAGDVAVTHHSVILVVVPHNTEACAQTLLEARDGGVQIFHNTVLEKNGPVRPEAGSC